MSQDSNLCTYMLRRLKISQVRVLTQSKISMHSCTQELKTGEVLSKSQFNERTVILYFPIYSTQGRVVSFCTVLRQSSTASSAYSKHCKSVVLVAPIS